MKRIEIPSFLEVQFCIYLRHVFVMQAIRHRGIFGDCQHGQMFARPQTVRRLQGQAVIFAEGPEMYFRSSIDAPFLHRVHHRHHLVKRNWKKEKFFHWNFISFGNMSTIFMYFLKILKYFQTGEKLLHCSRGAEFKSCVWINFNIWNKCANLVPMEFLITYDEKKLNSILFRVWEKFVLENIIEHFMGDMFKKDVVDK